MPRTRLRKTNFGVSTELMERAANPIFNDGRSLRSVAKDHNIPPSSLSRFCRKLRNPNMAAPPTTGYKPHNRVFSVNQERELADYLLKAADAFFGLTGREVRKLAFQLAQQRRLKFPSQWEREELAGIDWFYEFLRRHPSLSIRTPQATSLSRATSFNRRNVSSFFEKLQRLYEIHKLEPHSIYNMDETGVTTVQRPNKIIAKRGTKQVGGLTSGERGTLVTVALAVNAIGNSIPPQFVFPRKRYKDQFVQDGPLGCTGTGNSSGWMQEDDFLHYMKHFVKHSAATPQKKVLLILDNHDSHISLPVIDFSRENGIILLTLPPQCTHKMQPLDRSVFGPFKRYVNEACDIWMKTNPGRTMTIYNIPGIVKTALSKSTTTQNIVSGFSFTGIYPYNQNIFSEADFAPSAVSDRPELPHASSITPNASTAQCSIPAVIPPAIPMSILPFNVELEIENSYPLPRAEARKIVKSGRRKRKSEVLTESPYRNNLQENQLRPKVTAKNVVTPRQSVETVQTHQGQNFNRRKSARFVVPWL